MRTNILQPLLGSDKANPLFEILIDPKMPGELLVHFATHLMETVTAGSFEEKLLVARLYNAGFSRKRLQEVFDFDRKTMMAWGDALKSGDTARIQKIFFGQGPEPKIKPAHEAFIRKKYHELFPEHGCHTNAKIREALKGTFEIEVCHETIRSILTEEKTKAGEGVSLGARQDVVPLQYPLVRYSSEIETAKHISALFNRCLNRFPIHEAVPCAPVEKRENTCGNNIILGVDDSNISNYSPDFGHAELPGFPTVKKVVGQPFFCHHAGLVLCRLLIDKITGNLQQDRDVVRQWISMILCGCRNIENGLKLDYGALEFLVGKQLWSAPRQREKLQAVATEKKVLHLLLENIRFVSADLSDTFLYDPHSVGYTGMLKTLTGWLGASHKVGKAYYQDFIHTVDGAPVSLDIDDNYYDMRHRFVANVGKFRKILGGVQYRMLTFVVDRAIYDVEYMKMLRDEHNTFIITWEKNYKKGQWSEVAQGEIEQFYLIRRKNRAEDLITYQVRYVRRRWSKDASFSQFIILLNKPNSPPIELSVICSDETRPDSDTLYPILKRWLQENDFMFLIKLGINGVTSYKSFSYHEIADSLQDRDMDNKAKKKLCAERLKLQKKLGLELVKLENFQNEKEQFLASSQVKLTGLDAEIADLERQETAAEKLRETRVERERLKQKIKRFRKKETLFLEKNTNSCDKLRGEIRKAESEINIEPDELSRLESVLKAEYRKLNFMPKTLLDCVKVSARNIIYKLLGQFRPLYNNHRNDIVILRELIEASGHIEETSSTITISLYPSRHYSEGVRKIIRQFLMEISYDVNRTYKLDKIIIFDLYSPK